MQRLLLFRRDIITAAVLVTIIAAALVWFFAVRSPGAVLEVSVDGVLYGSYPLDTDIEIELSHNTLFIRDGYAYMEDADCPDKLCIKQGRIHYDGQSIVCLPNKVTAIVRKGESQGVDDVAR